MNGAQKCFECLECFGVDFYLVYIYNTFTWTLLVDDIFIWNLNDLNSEFQFNFWHMTMVDITKWFCRSLNKPKENLFFVKISYFLFTQNFYYFVFDESGIVSSKYHNGFMKIFSIFVHHLWPFINYSTD